MFRVTPVGLRGGMNTYGYVGGKPLRYFNSLGLLTCGSGGNEKYVPDYPMGFAFSGCCAAHDKCYDKCKSGKTNCDDGFLNCMLQACPSGSDGCTFLATLYFNAVNKHGQSAYDNAQKKACKGCKKDE